MRILDYQDVEQKFLIPFVDELKKVYKKKERTLIIAHNDVDGITSAAIFSKILENFGLEYKKDYFVYFGANEERKAELPETHPLIKKLKKSKVVVYLDYISIHGKGKKVFIVDHHNKQEGYDYEHATWFFPITDEIYRASTSAYCYAIYHALFGEDINMKIIGVIGAVGDSMFPNSLEYLKIEPNKQPFFVGRQISWIFFDVQKIFVLADSNESCTEIYHLLLEKTKSNSITDLVALPEPLETQIYKRRKKDIEVINSIKNRLEIHPDLKIIFLELTPAEARSKDAVFLYLWLYYPGYVVMISIDFHGIVSFSLRSNTYNLHDIFNRISMKLPDLIYGGHPFAAGGRIPASKIRILKDLIISEIKTGKIKKMG